MASEGVGRSKSARRKVGRFLTSATVPCMFADDFTMLEFDKNITNIEARLQADIDELLVWARDHDLKIKPTKSSMNST